MALLEVRIVGISGSCISAPPILGETAVHWPQLPGAGTQGPKGDKGERGIPGPRVAAAIYSGSSTYEGHTSMVVAAFLGPGFVTSFGKGNVLRVWPVRGETR